MDQRQLGRRGPLVSVLGFGAVKIGRIEAVKYANPYALPDDHQLAELIQGACDLGINYFDTAPAYGSSEIRLGNALASHRRDLVVSTKVGESFENGRSAFDFSRPAIEHSIERSLGRLQVDALDLVFIHSHGDDLMILRDTDAVSTLQRLRDQGLARMIGLSGKTVAGARAALEWADCLMVEYHLEDQSHAEVIAQAHQLGVGIVVKKPLASGRLSAADALQFVVANPGVSSVIVGTLSPEHLRANAQAVWHGPEQGDAGTTTSAMN